MDWVANSVQPLINQRENHLWISKELGLSICRSGEGNKCRSPLALFSCLPYAISVPTKQEPADISFGRLDGWQKERKVLRPLRFCPACQRRMELTEREFFGLDQPHEKDTLSPDSSDLEPQLGRMEAGQALISGKSTPKELVPRAQASFSANGSTSGVFVSWKQDMFPCLLPRNAQVAGRLALALLDSLSRPGDDFPQKAF